VFLVSARRCNNVIKRLGIDKVDRLGMTFLTSETHLLVHMPRVLREVQTDVARCVHVGNRLYCDDLGHIFLI
jgi:hypothetical protein